LLIQENVGERLGDMGIEMIGPAARSWLGVPLTLGGRVLGVMAVQSYTTPRLYDEHDRDLLTAVASQAAIALQNARLFGEAQRRAQRERQIYEITTKLRRSPDIATILQTAVDELGHALRADRALVRLGVKPAEGQRDTGGKADEAGEESPRG
jgi:GAF domain-containing protein